MATKDEEIHKTVTKPRAREDIFCAKKNPCMEKKVSKIIFMVSRGRSKCVLLRQKAREITKEFFCA